MWRDGLIEQGFLTQENSLARLDNFPSCDPVAPGLRSSADKFSAVDIVVYFYHPRLRAGGGQYVPSLCAKQRVCRIGDVFSASDYLVLRYCLPSNCQRLSV